MAYAIGLAPTEPFEGLPKYHTGVRALLGGFVVASALFFLVAVVRMPGLDPPSQSVALFIVATTAGVVSYLLVVQGRRSGYLAAVLTGLYALVAVGLVAGGVYGPVGGQTNPAGPLAYVMPAAAVVVTAGLAWRDRDVSTAFDAPSEAG
jgi:peptidoglycan/LPS O-acetylase OafA/YrhL